MSQLFYLPRERVLDNNAKPGDGWKLNFYKPDTSTRKDTYVDGALTTAHTNPVEADCAGEFPPIYMVGNYKVVLTDEKGVQKWTVDPYFAGSGAEVSADNIKDLTDITADNLGGGEMAFVRAFYSNTDTGGGHFYWDENRDKADANGGTVIDPDNVGTLSDTALGTYLSQQGTGSGSGCWVRLTGETYFASWFGVRPGETYDQSQLLNNLSASTPIGATISIEAGDYHLAAPMVAYGRKKLVGGGRTQAAALRAIGDNSVLKAENAGVGRSFDIEIEGVNCIASASATNATVDFRGVSYSSLRKVRVGTDGSIQNSALGLDIQRGGASFNGYIKLDEVYVSHHHAGVVADVNDLTILGGAYNQNATLGLDLSGAVHALIGSEVSNNGTTPGNRNTEGGVRFDGTGLFSTGVWNEGNVNRFDGSFSPNNWIVTENSSAVNIFQGRPNYGSSGLRSEGVGGDAGTYYRSNVGEALSETRSIVKNGDFSFVDGSMQPLGWSLEGDGTFSRPASPINKFGYSEGIIFEYGSGAPKLLQTLLTASDVVKYEGQKILVTWIFEIPSGADLSSNSNRIGIWRRSSLGFGSGAFINLSAFTERDVVVKYTAELDLTPDSSAITDPQDLAAAVQLSGDASTEIILWGCSISFGQTAWLGFHQTLTDRGGSMYGDFDMQGTLSIPTFSDNTSAVSGGLEPGQMYQTSSGEVRIVV